MLLKGLDAVDLCKMRGDDRRRLVANGIQPRVLVFFVNRRSVTLGAFTLKHILNGNTRFSQLSNHGSCKLKGPAQRCGLKAGLGEYTYWAFLRFDPSSHAVKSTHTNKTLSLL